MTSVINDYGFSLLDEWSRVVCSRRCIKGTPFADTNFTLLEGKFFQAMAFLGVKSVES